MLFLSTISKETARFLTAEDIRNMLRVSRPIAYRIIHNPGCPRVSVGRRILVPEQDFLLWVRSQNDLIDYTEGGAGREL